MIALSFSPTNIHRSLGSNEGGGVGDPGGHMGTKWAVAWGSISLIAAGGCGDRDPRQVRDSAASDSFTEGGSADAGGGTEAGADAAFDATHSWNADGALADAGTDAPHDGGRSDAAPPPPSPAQGRFGSEVFWASSDGEIAAADLNRDGRPDLIVGDLDVYVTLSEEGGGYHNTMRVPLSGNVIALATADMNHDGWSDVVILRAYDPFDPETTPTAVLVYVAEPGGTLAPPLVLPIDRATMLLVSDVNADGWNDLGVVVPDGVSSHQTIAMLLNDQAGGFAAPVLTATGLVYGEFCAADLDGDGHIDIGATYSTYYDVLGGDGSGNFGPRVRTTLGFFADHSACGDFDADGRADVALSDDDRVVVYLVETDGTLSSARELAPRRNTREETILVAGELDGMEPVDLVSIKQRERIVQPFLANRTRDFTPTTPGRSPLFVGDLVDNYEGRALLVDVDVDGHQDLLMRADLNRDSSVVSRPGRGDGTFAERPRAPRLMLGPGILFRWADFDGDGSDDALVLRSSDSLLLVGDGAQFLYRTAAGPVSSAEIPLGVGVEDLVGAQIDDDTTMDLVAAGPTLRVLLRGSDGTYGSPIPWAVVGRPSQVAVGDFDEDGHADIASLTDQGRDGAVVIAFGDGHGAMREQGAPLAASHEIAVGDVNGDSHLDIVMDLVGAGLSVLRGRGDGTFDPAEELADRHCHNLRLADLDHDGMDDVIATGWLVPEEPYTSHRLFVFLAASRVASGSWQEGRYEFHHGSYALGVADLDEDGQLDVYSALTPLGVCVARGSASGGLEPEHCYGDFDVPVIDVQAGDVDGDHHLDLIGLGSDGSLDALLN